MCWRRDWLHRRTVRYAVRSYRRCSGRCRRTRLNTKFSVHSVRDVRDQCVRVLHRYGDRVNTLRCQIRKLNLSRALHQCGALTEILVHADESVVQVIERGIA